LIPSLLWSDLGAVFRQTLLVTPDYDGGRRSVGALVLALAIPLALVAIAALKRLPKGRPR
jgi:hypothetical protein